MIRFPLFKLFLAFSLSLSLIACSENEESAPISTASLPEMSIGRADAPLTIIEYASMTCGHCANFHTLTLPQLKKDYIDNGKVRLVFREFPLDPWALASSLLARCVGGNSPKRFFAFLDILFHKQAEWANAENRMGALQKLSRQAGLSQKKFLSCFENKELLLGINGNKLKGGKAGVRATPSFYIGKTMVEGNQPYKKLREIIDGELP